jgi:uncharacterized phage protein (predicted DNA packaging)
MPYFTYEEFFGHRQIQEAIHCTYREFFALERAEAAVVIELKHGFDELNEAQVVAAREVVFDVAKRSLEGHSFDLTADQKAELALVMPNDLPHAWLALLKQHANISHADDDALLQHYLNAAEGWIADYIGRPIAQFTPLPAQLTQATLLLAAYWYEQREAGAFNVSINAIPFGVIDLVQPFRQWNFQHVE